MLSMTVTASARFVSVASSRRSTRRRSVNSRRVVERQRDAMGEVGGGAQVGVDVDRRLRLAHQRDHGQRAPAADQRDDDRRPVLLTPHRLVVLDPTTRTTADRTCSSPAAAERTRYAPRRPPGARPRDPAGSARASSAARRSMSVECADRLVRQRAVVCDDIDEAQVGHLGNGEIGELPEHLVRLERRAEQLAGAYQEVRARALVALEAELLAHAELLVTLRARAAARPRPRARRRSPRRRPRSSGPAA